MEMREVYAHFNLSGDPFTKEIKTEALQKLPGMKTALEQMQVLFTTKGIGILTGKSGSGKSCLLRMACQALPTGIYKSVYVHHTSVGILEFYTHLCDVFGLQPCGRRAAMFKLIHDHILHLNNSNRMHPILIIDEADKLGNDILQEIRLIANFDFDSINAITILLSGQEPLLQKLGLSILESLANSVTVTMHLQTLEMEETFSYLGQRVADVSDGKVIFTKSAMTLIHQASGGIMRVINNMALNCLIKAYYSNSSIVEKEHVQAILSR
jgi:general secretion pathway protein A